MRARLGVPQDAPGQYAVAFDRDRRLRGVEGGDGPLTSHVDEDIGVGQTAAWVIERDDSTAALPAHSSGIASDASASGVPPRPP